MRSVCLSLLGCAALIFATEAPASQKPCRDPNGKIITCPKAALKAAPPRQKDEKGRFAGAKTLAPAADHPLTDLSSSQFKP